MLIHQSHPAPTTVVTPEILHLICEKNMAECLEWYGLVDWPPYRQPCHPCNCLAEGSASEDQLLLDSFDHYRDALSDTDTHRTQRISAFDAL